MLSKSKKTVLHGMCMSNTDSVFSHTVPQTHCPFPGFNSFTFFVQILLAVAQPHLEARFGLQSALFFPTVGLG